MIAPMPAEMREMGDCEMDCRTGPLWLSALLQARFFTTCKLHASSGKSDKNMFCIDCAEECCPSCVPEEHEGHHVVQIRRSSYHEAVRVSDIQKLIDYTQVQLYVINSARIIFLNGRPPPRPMKGAEFLCEICGRMLIEDFRFCSLGCKLSAIHANPREMGLSMSPRPGAMKVLDENELNHVQKKFIIVRGQKVSPGKQQLLKKKASPKKSPKPASPRAGIKEGEREGVSRSERLQALLSRLQDKQGARTVQLGQGVGSESEQGLREELRNFLLELSTADSLSRDSLEERERALPLKKRHRGEDSWGTPPRRGARVDSSEESTSVDSGRPYRAVVKINGASQRIAMPPMEEEEMGSEGSWETPPRLNKRKGVPHRAPVW
ncbi:hypothetical protein KFL_000960190 [Klebsormidium nitens]|uniref:PLATZ transcription factor family protein n=1 Tax=Klebsormidium nitens TaxID=105231 RepID=A0A0U9HL34_KLENI|nr:hypothetical protein KFL_000960190 [Klebsormidium nitens]|eukprot:GAQ81968.1 hypothetical protein KFL_000960190 [Klebsormidium nitens]